MNPADNYNRNQLVNHIVNKARGNPNETLHLCSGLRTPESHTLLTALVQQADSLILNEIVNCQHIADVAENVESILAQRSLLMMLHSWTQPVDHGENEIDVHFHHHDHSHDAESSRDIETD